MVEMSLKAVIPLAVLEVTTAHHAREEDIDPSCDVDAESE